jgi:hypothetical protein
MPYAIRLFRNPRALFRLDETIFNKIPAINILVAKIMNEVLRSESSSPPPAPPISASSTNDTRARHRLQPNIEPMSRQMISITSPTGRPRIVISRCPTAMQLELILCSSSIRLLPDIAGLPVFLPQIYFCCPMRVIDVISRSLERYLTERDTEREIIRGSGLRHLIPPLSACWYNPVSLAGQCLLLFNMRWQLKCLSKAYFVIY